MHSAQPRFTVPFTGRHFLPSPKRHLEKGILTDERIVIPSTAPASGVYQRMSDDIHFYEYSESVAASDAQLNINIHISRMVHVKDWEDLFEDKIVNTGCIITLKMAVLYMDQREYLEGRLLFIVFPDFHYPKPLNCLLMLSLSTICKA